MNTKLDFETIDLLSKVITQFRRILNFGENLNGA